VRGGTRAGGLMPRYGDRFWRIKTEGD